MPQTATVKEQDELPVFQDSGDQGISPGEILRMLWRHKIFILICTLACFALAAAYVLLKHPVYEATATVRIDPGRTGSLGLADLGSVGSSDSGDLVHTEIAIMESDGVALRTLRDLPDKDFAALTGEQKGEVALPDSVDHLTPDQAGMLGAIQGPLTIKQQEGTSLIDLNYRSENPALAADVVNHLVAAYVVESFVDRDRSVSQLDKWLASQMTGLKKQVDAAQEQLSHFEESNHVLTEANGSNSITDRLRQLSDRLTTAQSDRIVKEGQLRVAQTSDLTVLAAQFPTSRLQALQAEQATASSHYQQLRSKFGANYPPLVQAGNQLTAIDGEISQEVQVIRRRLQEDYNASKATEDLLRQQYDDQTAVAFSFDRHQAEYAVLQAEVTSSRELYDVLRHKVQQAGIDAQISGLNTILVNNAYVPYYPVAPKKTIILIGGIVLGLFAGIAAALLLEAASDKLENVAQLGKAAPYPVIASIPASRRRRTRSDGGSSSLEMANSEPSSVVEAYRALRNILLLRSLNQEFTSVLLMAPSRREHVGEVAANTAVTLAQAGKRVLVVDADLQVPSLHEFFNVRNDAGLSEVLNGLNADSAYRQPLPEYPDLFLLTAGTPLTPFADTLIHEPFEATLRAWRANFDYILIKAAPLAEQSSGLLLAHWTDRSLIVTRYQETQVRTVRELRPLLDRAGADVLGIVVENAPQP